MCGCFGSMQRSGSLSPWRLPLMMRTMQTCQAARAKAEGARAGPAAWRGGQCRSAGLGACWERQGFWRSTEVSMFGQLMQGAVD